MRESRLTVLFLGFIAVFLLGVLLLQLRTVLLPLFVATLLSFIFRPIYLFLERKRVPTVLALISVLLVMASLILGVLLVVYSSYQAFLTEWPAYQARSIRLLNDASDTLLQGAQALWGDEVLDVGEALDFSAVTGFVTSLFTSSVGTFLSFLGNTVLILLFMFFMLVGSGQVKRKLAASLPEDRASRIIGIIQNTHEQIKKYLVTKTLVSLGVGVLTTTILLVLGVDFALLWGFIAFLFNFVPNVGSLFAVLFPVLIALIEHGFGYAILVLVLLVAAQATMGNVVEPRMLAQSMNLSPVLVLFALIFWGWLWGIWGMILAIPLTATVKILLENIGELRPIAALMSGPMSESG